MHITKWVKGCKKAPLHWKIKCRASHSHLLSNYWWHFLHRPICFSLALTRTLQIVSFHVRASVQAFTVDRHGNFCRVLSAGIWTSPAKAHYPLSTCPCPQSWSTRNMVYFWISNIALSWSALERLNLLFALISGSNLPILRISLKTHWRTCVPLYNQLHYSEGQVCFMQLVYQYPRKPVQVLKAAFLIGSLLKSHPPCLKIWSLLKSYLWPLLRNNISITITNTKNSISINLNINQLAKNKYFLQSADSKSVRKAA